MQDSCYHLDEFLFYFGGIKARSKRTIDEYRYDLSLFLRYLKRLRGQVPAQTPLSEVSIEDVDAEFLQAIKLSEIYRFISYLAQERENGPAARARRVAAIRAFFDYLHQKAGVLSTNPAAELESPKQPKRLPQYLELDESLALLDVAARSKDPNATRDFCILTLFLNCGLRLSELCTLRLSAIQEDTMRVIGKGNKERSIYLNASSKKALQQYLKERGTAKAGHEDFLFLSRNRTGISQRAVQNVVKKYLELAGLDTERYSTHKLRHTAATLMYRYGNADLRSLQQILGHESVATTEIYTHLNDEQLARAVENNPLNQIRKSLAEDTEE
ncbi:MAG: tyrosine recombinase XerC [Eubacteriales bacterium]|nr:tyrosine recombinase XerC [Eubacteriales bacterium]